MSHGQSSQCVVGMLSGIPKLKPLDLSNNIPNSMTHPGHTSFLAENVPYPPTFPEALTFCVSRHAWIDLNRTRVPESWASPCSNIWWKVNIAPVPMCVCVCVRDVSAGLFWAPCSVFDGRQSPGRLTAPHRASMIGPGIDQNASRALIHLRDPTKHLSMD